MKMIAKTHNPLFDIILLTLVFGLFLTALLGERPFSAPSESRYVEIGREMAETGNYVTPRLDYVKYFEKPPLFYWVQAAWTKAFGVGFFASRVPTAFFSLVLCLLTYGLGRMLYGRFAGALSSFVMATCLYLFALSRIVLLDVPVSVFLVGTLTAFLYAVNAPPGKKRCFVTYLMYVAAAGAVLTKGLIGMVLPGAVILLWFIFTGRGSLLKTMKLPTGTLLFLLIAVPWHILVWQHNPEQPQFYFIHEHFERFTTKEHHRFQPFWFFAPVLFAGLFPWVVFAYPAVRSGLKGAWAERKLDGNALFLGLWTILIFLFFSASDSKLIPYILPIFPPIAVMIGHYLSLIWREQPVKGFGRDGGFTVSLIKMLLLLVIVGALPLILSSLFDANSKVAIAINQGGEAVGHLSAFALVAAIAIFFACLQLRRKHVIMIFMLSAAVIAQMGDLIAANYTKDSMMGFANAIKSVEKPGDEVVSYDNYYQDLPVYLARRVGIVDWWNTDKSELVFGAHHEDTSAWLLTYDEFWKRWMTPNHHMFAVMREEAFDRIKTTKKPEDFHMYLLMQEGHNMLFGNMPADSLTPNKQ